MEAINARWLEFEEAADDEGRRNLFVKTLSEPELMDDEQAFAMLNELHGSAVKSGGRDQWEELVDQLHERLPDVYATSRKYYLHWRIENAVASGRSDRLPVLARELAETAGDDVDQFARDVDLLAYHGELAVLAEATRIAWPLIRDSSGIMWGQGDFAQWGADCVLFERLERTRELDGRDPELIGQMRFFFEDLQLDPFAVYVAHLSGRANRTWSLGDFQKLTHSAAGTRTRDYDDDEEESSDNQPIPNDGREALGSLVDDFVDYARHQEGVPYTKAALARDNISRYIMERLAGDLEPRQSMFDAVMNPQRKPKSNPKPRVPDHLLCPDRDTLDRFFSRLLNFMNPQKYDVAATFELMPAWLRFLEARGLIEPKQREATLTGLHGLHATLLRLWEADHTDPALAVNLRRWHETAARPDLLPAEH